VHDRKPPVKLIPRLVLKKNILRLTFFFIDILFCKLLLFYVKRIGFSLKVYITMKEKVLLLKLETGIIFIFITGDCQHG